MPITEDPPHIISFKDNMAQIARLLEIHGQIAGLDPGYKHGVEILNKSALVLLVACWEAFIEDLATEAFSVALDNATSPDDIPSKVLGLAANPLRNDEDQRALWALAGEGWRRVLLKHHDEILERYVGRLNTPRPQNVDAIFESLLGFRNISATWKWNGMEWGTPA